MEKATTCRVSFLCFFLFFCFVLIFEAGSPVAQVSLELTLNSRSSCLHLLRGGVVGKNHLAQVLLLTLEGGNGWCVCFYLMWILKKHAVCLAWHLGSEAGRLPYFNCSFRQRCQRGGRRLINRHLHPQPELCGGQPVLPVGSHGILKITLSSFRCTVTSECKLKIERVLGWLT